MKIKTLKVSNFMPYKGVQKVIFPQHEMQNVMLVFGDNMRGKTSILNALRWGFYGVAVGRHLREIPRTNLINIDAAAEGDWRMSVTLSFEHDGKDYELNRSIEKRQNTLKPRNDADFKESIGLKIDDTPVPGDLIVYEISQIMPKEISRFFLFDGELLEEYENLLADESEQGRLIKDRIESVLGVPALIHTRDVLNILLKEARSAQRKDAQKTDDLRKFAQDQQSLELKLEDIERNISDLESQEERQQEKIDEIDDFLKNTEAVQNRKIELTKLEAAQETAKKDVLRFGESNRELLRTVWNDVLANSVQSIIQDQEKERHRLQKDLEVSFVRQNRIDELKRSIEEGKECSTCGQKLPEAVTTKLQVQLDDLVARSEGVNIDVTTLSNLSTTIESLKGIRSEGEVGRIVKNLELVTAAKVSLMAAENRWEEIDEEIRGYDTDEIMRQRAQRGRWVQQLYKTRFSLEEAGDDKDQNTKKQEKISDLINKHGGTQGSRSNRRLDTLKQLETVFSKGIDQLRQKMKGNVEEFATKAFMQMTTEKTYAGLQINNSYGLSILDPQGEVLNERSAGAEQVVALALIDGLNKTSGTKAPIVMDTPLGRLDPKHRQNILQYLPDMAEQVVLLVHEGEIHAKRDIEGFASRIGARYEIKRVSATQSRIEKVI